jgi:phosphonate transport system substrate-binding protein
MKGGEKMEKKLLIFIGLLVIASAIFIGYSLTGNIVSDKEITVLRVGLIPADDAAEMLREYEPIKEYLAEELDMPVELKVTSDYTAAIEAMEYKHIDMAWFGPFSYVIANNVAGAEAIVNGVRRSDGESDYHSIIVANADSGIETLEDLKGKSFAFVDPASTSGNLMPRKILIENDIDPEEDFSEYYYAGTHNAVEYAISNGRVDAGADSDNSYDRMLAEGEIDPETNIIIYKSDSIPGSPIAVRGDLPDDLKEKITAALVDMDEQDIHKVGGWGDISSYKRVFDDEYDIIRDIARVLNMDVTTA